ncbi:MAG: hypothetical protein RIF41_36005 [Polyangiaceae bacterium]
MMKRLLAISMITSLFALACGKDAKPLVDAAEKYATDTCACKDADCLKKAADDYQASVKKLEGEKLTPSEEQAKKIGEATEKAVGCNTELATKFATEAAGAATKAAGEAAGDDAGDDAEE